jgi:hypothetical protein
MNENGIKALKHWIETHPDQLATYTTDDIVNLAIACGFDRQAVSQWATSQRFKEAI